MEVLSPPLAAAVSPTAIVLAPVARVPPPSATAPAPLVTALFPTASAPPPPLLAVLPMAIELLLVIVPSPLRADVPKAIAFCAAPVFAS